MKNFSRNLLFGAVLAALPMGGALACTTAAWDNSASTTAVAGDPGDGVARYSGECGLQPAGATGYVSTDTPDSESVYRARFYVFTGTGATGTIFAANDADGGAGNDVLTVDFNGTAFVFNDGGSNPSIGGIQANSWYSVEVLYQNGSAGSARVFGGADGVDDTVALAAGSADVQSAQLGAVAVAAGADTMRFDEFESTRDAATEIGPLCRGDANNQGANAGVLNVFDTVAIVQERVSGTLATGQPDCNEDGAINVFDTACIVNRRLNSETCP